MRAFAERERLKIRRDEVNEPMITGKPNTQAYDHGDGRLALMLLDMTPKKWGFRKRRCIAVGMELHQDGDAEGTLLFDPNDPEQVRVAVEVGRFRRKRKVSDAERERLIAQLGNRSDAPENGTVGA